MTLFNDGINSDRDKAKVPVANRSTTYCFETGSTLAVAG